MGNWELLREGVRDGIGSEGDQSVPIFSRACIEVGTN